MTENSLTNTEYSETLRVQAADAIEMQTVRGITISVPPMVCVWAGEYPEDCPDLLITVEHAVDADGKDLSLDIGRIIAAAIEAAEHPPVARC